MVLNHEAAWRDCDCDRRGLNLFWWFPRYDGGVGCGLGMWPVFGSRVASCVEGPTLWGRHSETHGADWWLDKIDVRLGVLRLFAIEIVKDVVFAVCMA